jgi:hypothetical protein
MAFPYLMPISEKFHRNFRHAIVNSLLGHRRDSFYVHHASFACCLELQNFLITSRMLSCHFGNWYEPVNLMFSSDIFMNSDSIWTNMFPIHPMAIRAEITSDRCLSGRGISMPHETCLECSTSLIQHWILNNLISAYIPYFPLKPVISMFNAERQNAQFISQVRGSNWRPTDTASLVWTEITELALDKDVMVRSKQA